ncbi:MAG: restriction endonuclease subunit S [Deltaproteobacteria bacterium]|nr:restriction endonuclease subunit S [Kofleriaceae bacterium]
MTPEGWSELAVGDFAEVKTGGTPRRDQERFWGGRIPWMSSGEVHKRLVWDTEEKITESALAESNARWLPAGSVVIALNGQGRTRGMAALLCAPMTCNQSLAAILPSQTVEPRFLLGALEAKYTALRGLTGDSGRNGLNLELVRSLRLVLPPLGEQRKVAAILSAVDDAIEAIQSVIDQLQVVKKAMMAELLARGLPGRHTRFKQTVIGEVPEAWQVIPLAQAATVGNGSTPSRQRVDYWSGGTVPWLPTGKVNDRVIQEADEFVTEKALSECPIRLLPKGTLLVAMIGQGKTRGKVAYLAIEASINQNFAYITPTPLVSSWFLFAYLESNYERLRSEGRGSNQDALNCGLIKQWRIPLPTMAEQEAIAAAMLAADERVDAETRSLAGLRVVKSALMSVLLTGEVRVIPDEEVGA